MRFCVDYGSMKSAKIPDTYHLPRIDDCIGSLDELAVLITLDDNSGYYPIPLNPTDRGKKIMSHCGASSYKRMPFASVTHQPHFNARWVLH